MNIVDYWKELVANYHHYNDFGTSDDFVRKLDENVPDWRQQVRDKNFWPGLHSYTANVRETSYITVIIREAGLEFAYYLIQKPDEQGTLDADCALSYCCEHIKEWNSFPDVVKERILKSSIGLSAFLNECLRNVNLWQSLTVIQKNNLFTNLVIEEDQYVSDILLFKIWSTELNYKKMPYMIFATSPFRHLAIDIIHTRKRDESFDRMIEYRLQGWDIPRLSLIHGEHREYLSYTPSEKLQQLKNVAESSEDELSLAIINSITSTIQHRLRNILR